MDTINRKLDSISSTLGEQAEKIRILQESKAKNEDEIKELRESLSSTGVLKLLNLRATLKIRLRFTGHKS